MKIILESDTEEDFLEMQLTEKEIKSLLAYHAVEGCNTSKERKPLNIFIRRGPNARQD